MTLDKKTTPVILGRWIRELGFEKRGIPVPFTSSCREHGFGVIAWFLMIPVFLIVLLLLAILFYEGRKAYWDMRVRNMCAEDGHVRVLEKTEIQKKVWNEMYRASGNSISLKMRESASASDVFYIESEEKNIRDANPRLLRTEWSVVRQADKKVVAKWNSYGRIGGDMPTGLAHDSVFRCPEWRQTWGELRELFLVKEGAE